MKYIKLLIIILFTIKIHSQSYDDIKKLDTVYIPFKTGRFDIKIEYPEETDGFKNRSYIFNYNNKKSHYFDFELKKNLDRILEIKTVDKSFFKKNKKKIVKIDNLEKFDYQDIQCKLFTRLKTYYIIDLSEKRDHVYKIYRVTHINSCITKE